jgi:predicted aspartyl protease
MNMRDTRRFGQRALLAVLVTLVTIGARAEEPQARGCAFSRIDEWPVRLVRGHLIVDGAINGRKVGVMLDTGATRSFVLRAAMDRLDLPRQQARGYRFYGIGGESNVDIVFLADFAIGEAKRKGWRVLSVGEHDFGDGAEFLLGEDFYRDIDVEFDLPNGVVRLFRAEHCDSAWLGYWSNDVQRIEIEPLDTSNPRIIVPVTLNGKTLSAMLDSGAFASMLDARDAAAVGLTPSTPGVKLIGWTSGVGVGRVDVWMGPLEHFKIGDEKVGDTAIKFADLYRDARYTVTGSRIPVRADALPMLLGSDFLQSHRVLVSHSQRMLYFQYVGGPVFRPGR